MAKTHNKFIALLVSIVMLFSLASVGVLAAGGGGNAGLQTNYLGTGFQMRIVNPDITMGNEGGTYAIEDAYTSCEDIKLVLGFNPNGGQKTFIGSFAPSELVYIADGEDVIATLGDESGILTMSEINKAPETSEFSNYCEATLTIKTSELEADKTYTLHFDQDWSSPQPKALGASADVTISTEGLKHQYGEDGICTVCGREAFSGIALMEDGRIAYVINDEVATDFTGLVDIEVEDENGEVVPVKVYIVDGYMAEDFTGFVELENGELWYVTEGEVDYDVTDIVEYSEGVWVYVENNLFTEVNSIKENQYGWWKLTDGIVDFDYTGIAENEYGWWRIVNGGVDFSAYGVFENEYGWWYVKDGAVDFNYNGIAANEYGWWKIVNGGVDFSAHGVFQNEWGWWYVDNGCVDFSYNGIASNEWGSWYIKNGQVNFDYSGKITVGGQKYTVQNGQVVA